ncbi:MAG: beta-class carbonic anhydrase [Anaerolineales bacterium]
MSAIDKVLDSNQRYAEIFNQGGLPGNPTRFGLAVVTCMDSRLHLSKLLGLELGDAHIIRNAGGIVTEDVLRSLVVSCQIAETQEVMIINHTECAMLTIKDEELAAKLQRETGEAPLTPARFYAFTDLEENVRQQMRELRSHPWIPASILVRGFIYDVDTGRLAEVSA